MFDKAFAYIKKNGLVLTLLLIVVIILVMGFTSKKNINNKPTSTSTVSTSSVSGVASTTSSTTPNIISKIKRATPLKWGAYVGDGGPAISDFENLVGRKWL